VDLVVERRQSDAILRADAVEERAQAGLRAGEPLLLEHRARRVEDEQDVRRLAVLPPGLLDRRQHARLGQAEHAPGLRGVDAVGGRDRRDRLGVEVGRAEAGARRDLGVILPARNFWKALAPSACSAAPTAR
jgi:hypothetical protein